MNLRKLVGKTLKATVGQENLARVIGVDIASKYPSVLFVLGCKLKELESKEKDTSDLVRSLWDLWFWILTVSFHRGKLEKKDLAFVGVLDIKDLANQKFYSYETEDKDKAQIALQLHDEVQQLLVPLVSREIISEQRYNTLPKAVSGVTTQGLLESDIQECLRLTTTKFNFTHIENQELELFQLWIVTSFVEVMVTTDGEPRDARLSHRGALWELVIQLLVFLFVRHDN